MVDSILHTLPKVVNFMSNVLTRTYQALVPLCGRECHSATVCNQYLDHEHPLAALEVIDRTISKSCPSLVSQS